MQLTSASADSTRYSWLSSTIQPGQPNQMVSPSASSLPCAMYDERPDARPPALRLRSTFPALTEAVTGSRFDTMISRLDMDRVPTCFLNHYYQAYIASNSLTWLG